MAHKQVLFQRNQK